MSALYLLHVEPTTAAVVCFFLVQDTGATSTYEWKHGG